jgi:hypothetical protein
MAWDLCIHLVELCMQLFDWLTSMFQQADPVIDHAKELADIHCMGMKRGPDKISLCDCLCDLLHHLLGLLLFFQLDCNHLLLKVVGPHSQL